MKWWEPLKRSCPSGFWWDAFCTGSRFSLPAGAGNQRDEIFLIDPRYGRIHHLNATGAALWRLLGDPLRLGEIVQTFSDAFPDSPRRVHKKRLKRILEDLDDSELLERPGEES